jgi:hypothetical protein
MSKKARLSHDQKRKQKLAKRNRRQLPSESLAYTGNRYKTKELVKPLFETEIGIYEAFVISQQHLTDGDVETELHDLIAELRERPAAELIYAEAADDDDEPRGLVTTTVFLRWGALLEKGVLPGRDELIGILRTTLGSLETWRSRSASSRGYLNYLQGFMNKMGVRVALADKDGAVLAGGPPDELYEIGEMWLAGSPEARHRFSALANELLEQGESQRVVDACQRLLGNIASPTRPEFPMLSELSIRAQKTQQKMSAPEFAPGIKSFISRLTGW